MGGGFGIPPLPCIFIIITSLIGIILFCNGIIIRLFPKLELYKVDRNVDLKKRSHQFILLGIVLQIPIILYWMLPIFFILF